MLAVFGGMHLYYRWTRNGSARPLVVAAGVVSMVLAVLTWREQQVWHDSERLWTRQLAVDPTSAVGHYNSAMVLLERRGPASDPEREPHLREAIRKFPQYGEAHGQLADVLRRHGEFAEAALHYEAALAARPDAVPVRSSLAGVLWESGRRSEAIAQLRLLVQQAPNEEQPYSFLARALAADGRLREALTTHDEGIGRCARSRLLRVEQAMLLATAPDAAVRDGARAMVLLDEAARLAGAPDEMMILALGAAYAAKGDFGQAAGVMNDAAAMAPRERAARFLELREQYRKGVPLVVESRFP